MRRRHLRVHRVGSEEEVVGPAVAVHEAPVRRTGLDPARAEVAGRL
jgi:hypothetical protein